MNVLLDTNILRSDPGTRSSRFEVLRDYLCRTQSRVLLPRLVFDEMRAVYSRELTDRAVRMAGATTSLAAFLPHRTDLAASPSFNIEAEVQAYAAYLLNQLGVSDQQLLPLDARYLDDVVQRAIWRRRPCTDRGEELRDALLWLMLLDSAERAPERRIAFVSANVKQFADELGALHPDLVTEATGRGVAISYYRSLEDFARQHASQVAFVTPEWIAARIPIADVLDAAEWSLLSRAETFLENALEAGEAAAGEARIVGSALGDLDWFVNELQDGSLRLEVIFPVRVAVEGPVWRSVWRVRALRRYDNRGGGDHAPDPSDYEPATESTTISTDMEAEIVVYATIREQQIIDWEVAEVAIS